MKNIAIIPARAGSKSIKNKNLRTINGKHLVNLTIDQAIQSNAFHQIHITTDIVPILESPRTGVIYHKRPDELATDDALMCDVIYDMIRSSNIPQDSYLWLLQPTSPFRTKEDFLRISKILKLKGPASLISMKDVGAAHPSRTYRIEAGYLKSFHISNFQNKQDLRPVYIRNGCFYVIKLLSFLEMKTFFIEPCAPYIMDDVHSVNIDSPLDLVVARVVAKEVLRDGSGRQKSV